jgi:hypothetical protein
MQASSVYQGNHRLQNREALKEFREFALNVIQRACEMGFQTQ